MSASIHDERLGIRPDGSVDLTQARAFLTEHPEWLEARDGNNDTLVMRAVGWFNPDLVELLIQLGANVNPEGDYGFPCLYSLADVDYYGWPRENAIRIANLLLDAGADIEQRGINDWTPLHRAACAGNIDMVRLFVSRGADINARTRIDEHETPLMTAAHRGNAHVVEYLLEKGADPSLRDLCGETAEEIARLSNCPEVVQVLQTFRGG